MTFSPELPAGEDWNALGTDVRKALSYFRGGYREFPAELIVRFQVAPFSATGLASSSDGTPIMEISYNLWEPYRADYRYVGKSSPIELPDEPDA